LAPSAKIGDETGDEADDKAGGFLSTMAGLEGAALGFDRSAGVEDVNRFDAALCDGLAVARFVDFAAVLRLFALLVFLAFADFAESDWRGGVLGDFLRDFLDIRLPFVAFGGSTIRLLRILSGGSDSSRLLGKSDGPGVWLQGFRSTTARSLAEGAFRTR
jgi:hypothetical protein